MTTLCLVPHEDIPAMEADGWRVVSRLERSHHGRWAVL